MDTKTVESSQFYYPQQDRIIFCGMELTSVHEAETICSLNLTDSEAEEEQRQAAIALFLLYLTGGKIAGETIPANEEKAEIYLAQASWSLAPESCWSATIHTYLSWWTSWRLAAIRTNREYLAITSHPFFSPSATYLLSIGGLSYWLEFINGLGHLIYGSFRPMTLQEADLSFCWRLLNVFSRFESTRFNALCYNVDFLRGMSNALLWGTLNTLCFIFTGIWPYVINLVGFSIDVVHDSVFAYLQWNEDTVLLRKFSVIGRGQDNNKLYDVTGELIRKAACTKNKFWTALMSSGGIVVGMGLFWFPPMVFFTPFIWQCAGASLTFIGGVLYGGLGARLRVHRYQKTISWLYSLVGGVILNLLTCAKTLCSYISRFFLRNRGLIATAPDLPASSQRTLQKIREQVGGAGDTTTDLIALLRGLTKHKKVACQSELNLDNKLWSQHILSLFKPNLARTELHRVNREDNFLRPQDELYQITPSHL